MEPLLDRLPRGIHLSSLWYPRLTNVSDEYYSARIYADTPLQCDVIINNLKMCIFLRSCCVWFAPVNQRHSENVSVNQEKFTYKCSYFLH